jgi:hypothetical protein
MIRAGLHERLLVCWIQFSALVDYNVSSLASRQSSSRNSLLIIILAPNNAKITQVVRVISVIELLRLYLY